MLSRLESVLKSLVVIMALATVVTVVALFPVDVPDANSPLEGNHSGIVNSANTVGQTLLVARNGLNRLEVTLSVANPVESEHVSLRVEEVPGKLLREVERPITALPPGQVGHFRPGTIMQRWYSFDFEPIPDSAGKRFFFALEGKELEDPKSVSLLMFFHNRYPDGEAFINGNPVGAYVVFRAYTRGRIIDLVGVLMGNMTRDGVGLAGNIPFLAGVATAYLLLTLGVAFVLKRTG